MNMEKYWASLANKLTVQQVQQQFPSLLSALLEQEEVESPDMLQGEFAYDLYPNVGPGGFTSDADEAAAPDEYADPVPTVSGKKSLFYYRPDIDELYDGENDWLCWNY